MVGRYPWTLTRNCRLHTQKGGRHRRRHGRRSHSNKSYRSSCRSPPRILMSWCVRQITLKAFIELAMQSPVGRGGPGLRPRGAYRTPDPGVIDQLILKWNSPALLVDHWNGKVDVEAAAVDRVEAW